MRVLRRGESSFGVSHADMINKAIGTNYKHWRSAAVDLEQFGSYGVMAWFVYMDGSEHGFEDGWRWKNRISEDGNAIREYNVSGYKEQLIEKRGDEGFRPFRLAFRIDALGDGDRYFCKFAGAFVLANFIREDLSAVKYVKVADEFTLGEDRKEFFIERYPRYNMRIAEMGFSDRTERFLHKYGISRAWQLLDMGLGTSGEIVAEIKRKLYEHFGEKEDG